MPQFEVRRPLPDELPVRPSKHGQAVAIPPRGLIVVSWSEIDTIRQCDMKHDLSYIERWTKPQRSDGALSRGTLYHSVMEVHYRVIASTQGARPGDKPTASAADRLASAKKAVAEYLFKAEREAGKDQAMLDTIDLVAWMYEGYVQRWGISPDWHILATEHAAQVRLPNEMGKPSRFALKLKIDLVIATKTLGGKNWRNWVVDFKTGKDLPKDKDFDFLDQFTLYSWSLRKIGRKVYGQMYDAIRTQRNKTPGQTIESRFSRTPMVRTDIELDRVAIEAYQTVSARYKDQVRLDKIGGEPPRSTDPERCSWRCDFTEPCLHGRKGGDMRDFLRSAGFEQRFERH